MSEEWSNPQPIDPARYALGVPLVWAMLALIVPATAYGVWHISQANNKLERISEQLAGMQQNNWTISQQSEWGHSLQAKNPTITVPSARDIPR